MKHIKTLRFLFYLNFKKTKSLSYIKISHKNNNKFTSRAFFIQVSTKPVKCTWSHLWRQLTGQKTVVLGLTVSFFWFVPSPQQIMSIQTKKEVGATAP